MAATRSTLEGVAALTKQLIALGKLDDGKALKMAVRAAMKPALARAKANIPVGTEPHRLRSGLLVAPGYAQSTLKIGVTINGDKNIASAVMSTGKGAYYAVKFVEFGTRKQAANPWFRRAFYDSRNDAEQALKDSLQRAVDRAAKTR